MVTETMKKELLDGKSPDRLLEGIPSESLGGYLNMMLGKRGMSVDVLAGLSALNRASLFRIINGTTRSPSRNVLLRLAIALELSFDETQLLLKLGNTATLSPKRERDVFVSYGIISKKPIDEISETLLKNGYSDLFGKD